MIKVERGDPLHPQAAALLRQSHALMQELFPPEDNFFLSFEELCAPDIRFMVAREGDSAILGVGALALRAGYGEVKSMFTDPAARGKGVAIAMLTAIETEARAHNLPALKLETGNVLYDAHRLYQRAGFTTCGPFGDYPDAASSVFMEKRLG